MRKKTSACMVGSSPNDEPWLSWHRHFLAAGLAVALSLGMAACSNSKDSSGSEAKPSESSAAAKVHYDDIAADAMVSTDMETLSEHTNPDAEQQWSPGKVPFSECFDGEEEGYEPKESLSLWFEGEPGILAISHAIEGSAADVYADLRKDWESKDCQTYKYKTEADDQEINLTNKRTQQIKAPTGVEKESWYGACDEGFDPKTNYRFGICRVIYLVDDKSFVELVTFQPPDENELNAAYLTLVAAEALAS